MKKALLILIALFLFEVAFGLALITYASNNHELPEQEVLPISDNVILVDEDGVASLRVNGMNYVVHDWYEYQNEFWKEVYGG